SGYVTSLPPGAERILRSLTGRDYRPILGRLPVVVPAPHQAHRRCTATVASPALSASYGRTHPVASPRAGQPEDRWSRNQRGRFRTPPGTLQPGPAAG